MNFRNLVYDLWTFRCEVQIIGHELQTNGHELQKYMCEICAILQVNFRLICLKFALVRFKLQMHLSEVGEKPTTNHLLAKRQMVKITQTVNLQPWHCRWAHLLGCLS